MCTGCWDERLTSRPALILLRSLRGQSAAGEAILPRALVEIAREQAKAGALAAAIETLREARSAALERTQQDSMSSERVRTIAEAQVEVGDLAGAKISAAAIETDEVEKPLALAALARGQAKAGDRQAANAALREAHARAQAIRAPRADLIGDNPTASDGARPARL